MAGNQQTLLVDDFSGGITDKYVSAEVNKMQKCDNFNITYHGNKGKLLSRPGSEILDVDYPRVAGSPDRINQLIKFEDETLIVSGRRIYWLETGVGWTEIQGPTNPAFPSTTTTSNVFTYGRWNHHLFMTCDDLDSKPIKIYKDENGDFKLRTAGMPELATSPTITPEAANGKNYIYAFVYYYTYQVGTVVFEDYGPVTQVEITNAGDFSGAANGNDVSAIPVIANGTTLNYDTTTVKVKIYRTIHNGTTFYYVGEVTNGTTTYEDATSDATLLTSSLLYTEGGVLSNDPPPPAKIVHCTKDYTYWAHFVDGTETLGNTYLQSVAGDPDSVPAGNYGELDEDIVGFSSVKSFGIALCDNSAYRIEGNFDELGRGFSTPFKISDTCSCVSAQSVVQTLDGVFWAGKDAFYFTDGYQVIKINEDWTDTYSSLVNTAAKKLKIQGKYDSFNRRIAWCVQEEDAATDVDKLYVLHLRSGISANSSFTTWSNENYFYPTAIEFDGANMLRGDYRGYVLNHSDSLSSDPKIDTGVAASSWIEVYIPWDYRGVAMDFGSSLERKYATSMILTCKNESNISVQIISNNDDNKKLYNLKPIRFRGTFLWGDPNVIWGDDSYTWNQSGLIEQSRWFPRGGLRFSYKQIQIQKARVAIYNSDLLGVGDSDATAKTLTLTETDMTFPEDIVDYFVSFSGDDYTKEYQITSRDSDTVLTYLDNSNTSTTVVGTDWVIRGYPKEETLNILSYTIGFVVFGNTQESYSTAQSGEVGSGS